MRTFIKALFNIPMSWGQKCARPSNVAVVIPRSLLIVFTFIAATAYGSPVACSNSASDAAAIQSALNGGGTVTLTGTCNVGATTFTVPVAKTTITGTATLNSTSSSYIFNVGVNGVTFNGLTLNGAGVTLTQAVQTTGFTFTNMTVENTHAKTAIQVNGILSLGNIQHNYFYYIAPDNALTNGPVVFGFPPGQPSCYTNGPGCDTLAAGLGINIYGGLDQSLIQYNKFDVMGNDSVHVGWNIVAADQYYYQTKNSSISYNEFSRQHRMGIELQDTFAGSCGPTGANACDYGLVTSANTKIAGNWWHDPIVTYADTYGYSLTSAGSAQYLNNSALAPNSIASNNGIGYGIEHGGYNVLTQGNVIAAESNEKWYYIVFGPNQANDVTTIQMNTLCGPQATTSNFGREPNNVTGTYISQYNYISNTCYNSGAIEASVITPTFTSANNQSIAAGATGTWNLSVTSSLPVRYVNFYVDGSSTPLVTQEVQDLNTNFANDRKWFYHASFNASAVSSGNHTLTALVTDVSGASRSVSQSFSAASTGAPSVQVAPAGIAFGSQTMGLVSSSQTVTVKNTGTAALSISGISASGTFASDFSLSPTCGASLAAGASCVISTTFKPSTAGSESADITISDNAAGSSQSVTLSGTGVAPSGGQPPTPVTTGPLPTNLPKGMILWLANNAGLVTDGKAVSVWEDQSGKHNDASQAAQGNQPTVIAGNNQQNALHFDGVASFLSIPSMPIDGLTGMTVFVVSANSKDVSSSAGYGAYALLDWTEATSWGETYFGSYETSSQFRFGTTQSGNVEGYTMSFTRTNSFGLSEWMHAGTTDSMWFNGQNAATFPSKMETIGGAGTSVLLGQSNNGTFYPGDVSEIVVYARSLSDSERQSVELYLMTKYHL